MIVHTQMTASLRDAVLAVLPDADDAAGQQQANQAAAPRLDDWLGGAASDKGAYALMPSDDPETYAVLSITKAEQSVATRIGYAEDGFEATMLVARHAKRTGATLVELPDLDPAALARDRFRMLEAVKADRIAIFDKSALARLAARNTLTAEDASFLEANLDRAATLADDGEIHTISFGTCLLKAFAVTDGTTAAIDPAYPFTLRRSRDGSAMAGPATVWAAMVVGDLPATTDEPDLHAEGDSDRALGNAAFMAALSDYRRHDAPTDGVLPAEGGRSFNVMLFDDLARALRYAMAAVAPRSPRQAAELRDAHVAKAIAAAMPDIDDDGIAAALAAIDVKACRMDRRFGSTTEIPFKNGITIRATKSICETTVTELPFEIDVPATWDTPSDGLAEIVANHGATATLDPRLANLLDRCCWRWKTSDEFSADAGESDGPAMPSAWTADETRRKTYWRSIGAAMRFALACKTDDQRRTASALGVPTHRVAVASASMN